MPEEVTRYPYKEPTWFIARTSHSTRKACASPTRTTSIKGSPIRTQGSPVQLRTIGVPSGQSARRSINTPRQDHAGITSHQLPDLTSVAMLTNNQAHQQPFRTVSLSYQRGSIPSASPISHAWGHRVVLNQVAANSNDPSTGHPSGRSSRSCAHRQTSEHAVPLLVTVKPLVVDTDQRASHGSARSVSPLALRATSQSTYRLVPVDNTARLLRQHPSGSSFRPLTTSLTSMAPPSTSSTTERLPHAVDTADASARFVEREPDPDVTSGQPTEPMAEGPEASESRMYVRGRFIYTPEETDINDNSCISFAY